MGDRMLTGADDTARISRREFLRSAAGAAAVGIAAAGTGIQTAEAVEGGKGNATGLSYVNVNYPGAATLVPEGDAFERTLEPEVPEVQIIAANEASWKLYATPSPTPLAVKAENVKRILVVVDYQNDFVDGGAFGHIEPAIAIEDALYDVIKSYQEAGDIVIYTMDTHPADTYPYTREGQFNPPHCIPGTPGWEIHGRVAELLTPEKAIQVKKPTYGSRNLPSIVQNILDQGIAVQSIEFAGVSTTCRVLHNAIILYNFFPDLMMIF
ncbi:MAG: cysteine hydrolase, partial [Eggerthellaceae bacterium]|nr:cysteine hydrolase [Eggerthellaceae bacterium]